MKEPASPCISICQLGPTGRCIGCARTGAQIARWPGADRAEKEAILREIKSFSETCGQCGRPFVCGAQSGQACWCQQLAPVLPVTAGTHCLCPVCLSTLTPPIAG